MSTSDQLFAQLMLLLVVLIMVAPVVISNWRKAHRTPPTSDYPRRKIKLGRDE
jgi:hypothetical protein